MTPARDSDDNMGIEIQGNYQGRMKPVVDAFELGFRNRPKMGAALSIWVDGVEALSIRGGFSDYDTQSRWDEKTLSVIFSCTKGLISILTAQFVEAGILKYQDRVSKYWPEFGSHGKAEITIAEALSHKAGLAAPISDVSPVEVLDWDFMTNLLANQEPLWSPGTGHAYHAITHGWLVGEVLRRVSGKNLGQLIKDQISEPLAADVWLGLPSELLERVATMRAADSLRELTKVQQEESIKTGFDLSIRSMTLGTAFPPELVSPSGAFNSAEVQTAEIGSAGGIATASGLAKVWSSTVTLTEGRRLISPGTLAQAVEIQAKGQPVWNSPEPWPRYGMGFQLDSEARRYLSSAGFGHDGAGGQVSFADPINNVGFAYLTNEMEALGDTRATAVINALSEVLTCE